jgi:transposase-like protein
MIEVSCPDCQRSNVVKAGKQPNGTQRYRCQNPGCERTIFQLAYVAHGRLPATQRLIIDMVLNGSGIRDTAHVLKVSPVTVLGVLKKSGGLNLGQYSSVGRPGCHRYRCIAGTGGGGRSR